MENCLHSRQVYKTFSSSAQYVRLQKYFSHSSLVIYFFPAPPIKLQIGGDY
jgi:hypothetical protein